ncbi:hypothetical protein RAS1_19020 [Phycisphaerae bacterium RAS1]|nr:hypothetical protein RAS1_19020 [Phycisphaerae bacterium RAS1]
MHNVGPPRPALRATAGFALLLFLPLAACTPASRVQFTSYKDPYFPETFDVDFENCAYHYSPAGDLHIAAQRSWAPGERRADTVRQYIHVHVFWKPHPGRTFANASSDDALIEYAVVSRQGAAFYSGTGFLYPAKIKDGRLTCRLEQARIRLDSQIGAPPEDLGDARVKATFNARDDGNAAVDMFHDLEIARSMKPRGAARGG